MNHRNRQASATRLTCGSLLLSAAVAVAGCRNKDNSSPPEPKPTPDPNARAATLTYAGSFALPHGIPLGAGASISWRADGDPDSPGDGYAGSLLLTDASGFIAAVSIPRPAFPGATQLPVARLLPHTPNATQALPAGTDHGAGIAYRLGTDTPAGPDAAQMLIRVYRVH